MAKSFRKFYFWYVTTVLRTASVTVNTRFGFFSSFHSYFMIIYIVLEMNIIKNDFIYRICLSAVGQFVKVETAKRIKRQERNEKKQKKRRKIENTNRRAQSLYSFHWLAKRTWKQRTKMISRRFWRTHSTHSCCGRMKMTTRSRSRALTHSEYIQKNQLLLINSDIINLHAYKYKFKFAQKKTMRCIYTQEKNK